jgi:hypothetical protein
MRQSLASMKRGPIKLREPMFSQIDIFGSGNHSVLMAYATIMSRMEFACFTLNMQQSNAPERQVDDMQKTDTSDIHRFLSKTKENGIEMKLRGDYTVDDIVNNAIHVKLFHGIQQCPWGPCKVRVSSSADILEHIKNNHRKLIDNYFSCPTCIGITICHWKHEDPALDYCHHWLRAHEPNINLMSILDESSTHVRHQWGHSIFNLINVLTTWPIMFDPNVQIESELQEKQPDIQPTGGYFENGLSMTQAELIEKLKSQIREKRADLLPEDLKYEVLASQAKQNAAKRVKAQPLPESKNDHKNSKNKKMTLQEYIRRQEQTQKRSSPDDDADIEKTDWIEAVRRHCKPTPTSYNMPSAKQPLDLVPLPQRRSYSRIKKASGVSRIDTSEEARDIEIATQVLNQPVIDVDDDEPVAGPSGSQDNMDTEEGQFETTSSETEQAPEDADLNLYDDLFNM